MQRNSTTFNFLCDNQRFSVCYIYLEIKCLFILVKKYLGAILNFPLRRGHLPEHGCLICSK